MSWNGPRVVAALVALLLWGAALRCVAGDSYLDRSKAQEAIPYGTTIDAPPPRKDAGAAGRGEDDARPTTPPSEAPSRTDEPAGTRRGSEPDRSR
jgi:hypothetical protein